MTRPHYMENRIRETLKAFVPGDTFTVFKIQQEAAKDARPYVPGTSTVSGLLRTLAAAGTLEKIPGTRGEYRHMAAPPVQVPVPQEPLLAEAEIVSAPAPVDPIASLIARADLLLERLDLLRDLEARVGEGVLALLNREAK